MDQIQEKILSQGWFDKWHVFAAWLYLIIVSFDFLIAPIFNNLIAVYTHSPLNIWQPITLQGGSMFHISMTAIIGISTYGKSQQLVETIKNMPDYSNMSTSSSTTTSVSVSPLLSNKTVETSIDQKTTTNVDPVVELPPSHRGIGKG